LGLNKDDAQDLNAASGGSFLSLSVSEVRLVLDKILERTTCTSIHDELLEEEKESSPEQEDEVLIAKSQPFQSQDLAISPESSISQNPLREEEIPPLESSFEFKDNLIDFGRTMKPRPDKRSPSEYNPTPLKEESIKKRPYSHIGYQEELKDDISSAAIEGEPNHLEVNPTFSPSMPTLDVLSKPIFQPILDPDDPSYALSPKSHDDPINLLRQPNHRNHEDYKDGQEEQR
jgi:hypothetical protein